MNLNELSQKLEDHLTDQDIQDAQELLDSTHQKIVDMRGELVEAQAELSALRTAAIAGAAEIERLKAQNAELLAAQQWRGIESAPRDGTRILVYAADTHEIFSVSWMTAQEDGSQEWIAFRFDKIGAVAIHNATLWQPMPWPETIAKARGESV